LSLAAIVFTSAVLYLVKPDPEAAVDFDVPIPVQCEPGWQGEVLENPSLKVSNNIFQFLPSAEKKRQFEHKGSEPGTSEQDKSRRHTIAGYGRDEGQRDQLCELDSY